MISLPGPRWICLSHRQLHGRSISLHDYSRRLELARKHGCDLEDLYITIMLKQQATRAAQRARRRQVHDGPCTARAPPSSSHADVARLAARAWQRGRGPCSRDANAGLTQTAPTDISRLATAGAARAGPSTRVPRRDRRCGARRHRPALLAAGASQPVFAAGAAAARHARARARRVRGRQACAHA